MYPRIRDLREDKDLTQTKLAKLIDMSQTGYSKYETGENDIPTNILIKLAQLHETSVDYLLGLTDEKKRILPAKNKDLAKFACLSLIRLSLRIILCTSLTRIFYDTTFPSKILSISRDSVSSSPYRALQISSFISSSDMPCGKFFSDCALRDRNACIAFSLVISSSGDAISNGILRSRTTALANTLIAVDAVIPKSVHKSSNCLFPISIFPKGGEIAAQKCAILNFWINDRNELVFLKEYGQWL